MRPSTILFLAADPRDGRDLALNEEYRAIESNIRAASFRDQLRVRALSAVRPDDLLQTLPSVLHVSGHATDGLTETVRAASRSVKVLFLNASHTEDLARDAVSHIPCVIVMDHAAIVYAGAFYRALAFAEPVANAHQWGLAALASSSPAGRQAPTLLTRPDIDPMQVYLVDPRPEATTDDPGAQVHLEIQVDELDARTLAAFVEDRSVRLVCVSKGSVTVAASREAAAILLERHRTGQWRDIGGSAVTKVIGVGQIATYARGHIAAAAGLVRGQRTAIPLPRSHELVEEALNAVESRSPADADILTGLIDELKATSQLLDRQRPLRRPTALGGEPRNEQTLIDHLCTIDGLSGDLVLPLKATLSRTHLLTKINFLRAFVKATSALAHDVPGGPRMTHDLREDLAQSIYTLLAEELLLALLRKPDVGRRTKQRAADQLITIWDDAALEIDDFAPLLESAWHARNRINSAYGTLLGATETFRLVIEDCSPDVIDFFGRADMSVDESAAFEEFLFNMTSEELSTLRHAMQRQHLSAASPAWAAEILGRQIEELEHSHEIDPIALYRSYQRRQLAADFRWMSGAAGPRRTAEGYLMVSLLDQQ